MRRQSTVDTSLQIDIRERCPYRTRPRSVQADHHGVDHVNRETLSDSLSQSRLYPFHIHRSARPASPAYVHLAAQPCSEGGISQTCPQDHLIPGGQCWSLPSHRNEVTKLSSPLLEEALLDSSYSLVRLFRKGTCIGNHTAALLPHHGTAHRVRSVHV